MERGEEVRGTGLRGGRKSTGMRKGRCVDEHSVKKSGQNEQY